MDADKRGASAKIIKSYHVEYQGTRTDSDFIREQSELAILSHVNNVLQSDNVWLSSLSLKRLSSTLYEYDLTYLSPEHREWEEQDDSTKKKAYDPPDLSWTTTGERQHITHSKKPGRPGA